MDNLINCVEAILLSSGRPVKISEIRELIRLMDQQAELADIKKGQDSIKNLNEQRNQKLNDELMKRLLK